MSRPRLELDWDSSPGVLDAALTLALEPTDCDLDYWLGEVAGGTLRGLVGGHRPTTVTSSAVREPGPLRDALIAEFAFQSLVEEKAARAIAHLVPLAPDHASMEFYVTQLVDETRHARTYRQHLLDVGVAADEVADTVETVAGRHAREILFPLDAFGMEILGRGQFHAAVLVLTVVAEGVIAPLAELGERKWHPLDPAAAEIQRGAGLDELRHLAVGGGIVARHLAQDPGRREQLRELVERGRLLWQRLPLTERLTYQETLFQQGLEQHADLVGDYEIWPGRRLVDTTVAERVETAWRWTRETQDARLRQMGLEVAR